MKMGRRGHPIGQKRPDRSEASDIGLKHLKTKWMKIQHTGMKYTQNWAKRINTAR